MNINIFIIQQWTQTSLWCSSEHSLCSRREQWRTDAWLKRCLAFCIKEEEGRGQDWLRWLWRIMKLFRIQEDDGVYEKQIWRLWKGSRTGEIGVLSLKRAWRPWKGQRQFLPTRNINIYNSWPWMWSFRKGSDDFAWDPQPMKWIWSLNKEYLGNGRSSNITWAREGTELEKKEMDGCKKDLEPCKIDWRLFKECTGNGQCRDGPTSQHNDINASRSEKGMKSVRKGLRLQKESKTSKMNLTSV